MIANLHTHTSRCNHAQGREADYVQAALDRGFEILGFSDHTPYFFPGEYYSSFRMRPEQLDDYCDTVRQLQRQYGSRIQIPLGLELEYYPDLIGQVLPLLRDHGIEYLLLGQHFVGNEMGEHYSGAPTGDESILRRYCDQSIDAMQTGLFTYFAHPDLIKFVGSDHAYRRELRRICREAKDCGMPLEINMLGALTGRNYPDLRFWELAAEEGCSVIIGCDAHAPEQLRSEKLEEQLVQMARKLGLTLLENTPLVGIG